jgi:dolichol kinase
VFLILQDSKEAKGFCVYESAVSMLERLSNACVSTSMHCSRVRVNSTYVSASQLSSTFLHSTKAVTCFVILS